LSCPPCHVAPGIRITTIGSPQWPNSRQPRAARIGSAG
jgi:hypothetical protein